MIECIVSTFLWNDLIKGQFLPVFHIIYQRLQFSIWLQVVNCISRIFFLHSTLLKTGQECPPWDKQDKIRTVITDSKRDWKIIQKVTEAPWSIMLTMIIWCALQEERRQKDSSTRRDQLRGLQMPYLHAWQSSYGRIKTPIQSLMVWLLLKRKEMCKYQFICKMNTFFPCVNIAQTWAPGYAS